jgi:hypothetical protein
MVQNQEARVNLAINAIRSSKKLSRRAAAKLYNIPEATLRDRMNGRHPRVETRPNCQLLTETEEEVIVQYILDLDSRGFPPLIEDIREMADHILGTRGTKRVGKQWPYRFIKRRGELCTRFSRAYDFQRALCEDPKIIGAWFQLVFNMRAKYGILNCDFYNFDETGFMMGQICPSMVVTRSDRRGKGKTVQPGNREWATAITCISGDGFDIPPFLLVQGRYHLASWYTEGGLPDSWAIKPTSNGWTDNETGLDWIKHFDKHTRARTKGGYRMLVLDGHESHQSVNFEAYCKDHNIIPICLPPHSSHITQPLDIGFFSVLKRAYGREINTFIRAHINHITKVEFFLAFYAAYKRSMTKANMAGGFRGAGLIPFDPQAVISKLDVKLRTPTPTGPPNADIDPWVSQTPHNPTEVISQSILVKDRISGHQGSSPTPIFSAVQQLAKGVETLAHSVTLLTSENHNLRKANEALSKRRRAKKTRVRQGGTLTTEDARDILAQKEAEEQVKQDRRENDGDGEGRPVTVRRCGNCGEPGHNARTCQVELEMSDVYSSE